MRDSGERSAFGSRRCLYERFRPADKQPEEKPAGKEPKPDAPSPAKPERPEFPLHDAGKIRDAKINRAIAEELISRSRAAAGADRHWALKWNPKSIEPARWSAGRSLTIASGGRVRAEYQTRREANRCGL